MFMNSINDHQSGYEKRTLLKKEKVKNTAKKMLQENMDGSINMDILAERSGIAKMSIYNYFESKAGLISEIMLELLESDYKLITELMNSNKTFKEKLTEYLLTKYKFISSGYIPSLYNMLNDNLVIAETFSDYQDGAVLMISKLIKQGKKEGEIDPDIPTEIIFQWMQILIAAFEKDSLLAKKIETDYDYFNKLIMVFWNGLKKQ